MGRILLQGGEYVTIPIAKILSWTTANCVAEFALYDDQTYAVAERFYNECFNTAYPVNQIKDGDYVTLSGAKIRITTLDTSEYNCSGRIATRYLDFLRDNNMVARYSIGSTQQAISYWGSTPRYMSICGFVEGSAVHFCHGTWYFNYERQPYYIPATNKGYLGYSSVNAPGMVKFTLPITDIAIYDTPQNYPILTPPTTGGGEGTGELTTDPIDFPSNPLISAVETGFVTAYNPSIVQVQRLASYMWSQDLTKLDTWLKLFANPMDCIIALHMLPCEVPHGGDQTVYVGNWSTNVTMPVTSQNYVEVDCGSINVKELTGSYLDFSPYTRAIIYLPYIGFKQLDIDDIMAQTIAVKYLVDVLTGTCVCNIKCGDAVKYSYAGNCAMSVPITSAMYGDLIGGITRMLSIAQTVATGQPNAGTDTDQPLASSLVNAFKPEVSHSGTIAGTSGYMAIQYPYLVFHHPNLALPPTYKDICGYPSLMSGKLGDFSGYTKIEECHVDGLTCTQNESDEIHQLLLNGIIV